MICTITNSTIGSLKCGKNTVRSKPATERESQRNMVSPIFGMLCSSGHGQIFSSRKYSTLPGTYSDHIAIEKRIQMEFFSKIEVTIHTHGGTITIYDTIDLQLVRKP